MKTNHLTLLTCSFAVVAISYQCTEPSKNTKESMTNYPKAEKKPTVFTEHGKERTDNYFWLRDRENQEVIDYLNAENAYTEEQLADVRTLRDELFEEIKGRIEQTDMSVPYNLKGYTYYTRYEEGLEYPFHCRKVIGSEEEEIMLDVNELAKPFSYYNAGGLDVSPDNILLAFGEDTLSRRIYTLRFKNLQTGEFLSDRIEGTTGSVAWAKDNKTVYYTRKDPMTLRSSKVLKHVLGKPVTEDEVIFDETDDTFGVSTYLSKSEDYIFIASYSTLSTEYRYLAADRPGEAFKVIEPRTRGLEYSVSHYKDHFYIVNNDQARNFKLSRTSVKNPGIANWEDVIGHRDSVLLEGIEIFKDFLVVEERSNGLTQLHVKPWKATSEEHYISFRDPAYMAYLSTNPEFDTQVVRYGYSSLTTPNSVYDYDMRSKNAELLKQHKVIGDFNPENYTSERIFVDARDGTKIPVSIVYRKGFKKDGSQPLLLYGYGSYGNSIDAYFSSARLSLLDRGFAYAIAHIRGGQEMGRHWYEDGKLLKKVNTFTDFIDCGDYLVNQNYTSYDGLFAMGGSAGGLLMGAVVNMRPEMWKGIVAAVPFVDVVTTMMDASIPLTTGEYDEWGNPNDSAYHSYILSYSPYDNVEAKAYPSMLITTGLHDSQVQYWEPAKWVAKLRELKTDTNLVLLHTNMQTGHGGASGRFERLKEVALEYAYLLKLSGRTNQ